MNSPLGKLKLKLGMKSLRLKYRRAYSSYHCHRHRGKTHFQILLELLSKLNTSPFWSTRLMWISLKRHGIGTKNSLAELLRHHGTDFESVECREILSGQFFVNLRDEKLWETYRSRFGHKMQTVIEDADAICRHEFHLLGSGASHWGNPINWHLDPVSGYCWPKKFSFELKHAWDNSDGRDIKLPWELSRMQHLATLGKAYGLTKNERYAREIVDQITHWLDDNPCPFGVNWLCAMDVAMRIMNMTWAYLFIRDTSAVTNEFRSRLAASIFQHGQFIRYNLEYGVRDDGSITNSNHYLTNIIGLLHLGLVCPEFKMAETWKGIGLTALVEEMDRQIHPDGSDFESSIPYHRLALELFVAGALLCRLNGVTLPKNFWEKLQRMFEFVLYVTRPDGKAPQVGDADDGRLYILSDYSNWDRTDFRYLLSIGAALFDRSDVKAHSGGFSEDSFWLLGPRGMIAFDALEDKEEGLGSKEFRDSGLYVMRDGHSYLLACCGMVGTGGVGNHKHNDLLSFELYVGDKAFIVDPGAYVYTRDPGWRNLFRSTKYHNSVIVDAQEQNRFETNHLFQMADDAAVIVHGWVSTGSNDWLDAVHTGYTRFAQPVQHRRTFLFQKQTANWEITDVLVGAGDHAADWVFHFDHGIDLEPAGEGAFRTSCRGTNIAIVAHAAVPLVFRIVDGWVSRRYGHKLPAKILHMSGTFNSTCQMVLTIRTV